MLNIHFPQMAPVVARDAELQVRYRLRYNPRIKVRKGESLSPERVVAEYEPTAAAVRVPLADPLGVSAGDVSRCLTRPVGSEVAAGESIAKHRRALRNLSVEAPVGGTLVGIDAGTGDALVAPAGAGQHRALLPGDVEAIEGKDCLVIRTVGTGLLGMVGLGKPVAGPIRVGVNAADDFLAVESINSNMAGAIVVGGRGVTAAALRRLVEVGTAGLIVGGMQPRELAEAFGWASEDRLALWRSRADRPVLGADAATPISVMATEGFGAIPMCQAVFDLLRELDGEQGVLLPETAAHGQVSRPQLIVADPNAVDRDASPTHLEFVPGAVGRLGDQASLGQAVTVVSELLYHEVGDGRSELGVEVEFPDGRRRVVPAANLEIIG